MTWARRLKRVFDIDIAICGACGGAVKVIVSIEDLTAIKQILTHLERKSKINRIHFITRNQGAATATVGAAASL